MEIGDGARGVLLGEALGTMVVAETEVTRAIDGDDEVTLKTEIIQGFHADQPQGVPVEQLGEGGTADVSNKVIQGLGDRQAILLRASQVIEVMEDGAFQVAQVVIGGTAAAQAQPKEKQPPPAEEAAVVLDHGFVAGVGQLVLPARQVREEMADGLEKGPGQGYDLPHLRRWAVTWVWIKARDS